MSSHIENQARSRASAFPSSNLVFLWFVLHPFPKVISLKFRPFPSVYFSQPPHSPSSNVSGRVDIFSLPLFLSPSPTSPLSSLSPHSCLCFSSTFYFSPLDLCLSFDSNTLCFRWLKCLYTSCTVLPRSLSGPGWHCSIYLGSSLGNHHSPPEASAYHSPELGLILRSPFLAFPEFLCVSQPPN